MSNKQKTRGATIWFRLCRAGLNSALVGYGALLGAALAEMISSPSVPHGVGVLAHIILFGIEVVKAWKSRQRRLRLLRERRPQNVKWLV